MKRILSFIIIISFLLCSCQSKEKIFEFQEAGGEYRGNISYLGDTFSAIITLSPAVDGKRETVQIEYLTPESVAGYKVKREGDKYYAVISDLEIPVTGTSLPQLSYTEALFSLRDGDVSSVETDGVGNTVVRVHCGKYGADAVAVFSPDGGLISLSLGEVDFSITFK